MKFACTVVMCVSCARGISQQTMPKDENRSSHATAQTTASATPDGAARSATGREPGSGAPCDTAIASQSRVLKAAKCGCTSHADCIEYLCDAVRRDADTDRIWEEMQRAAAACGARIAVPDCVDWLQPRCHRNCCEMIREQPDRKSRTNPPASDIHDDSSRTRRRRSS